VHFSATRAVSFGLSLNVRPTNLLLLRNCDRADLVMTEFSRLWPIWVDFSKGGLTLDGGRFVTLAALGTLRDLFIDGRRLAEGQDIVVYTDDVSDSGEACYLLARGTVHYDAGRREWWAKLGQVVRTGELPSESGAWIREVDSGAISGRAAAAL
jgi:hypothetical protein